MNRKNGLVPDRWPTPSFSSIAAVGFALPAYAIGVERGWCTRAEARDLTLTTLRFFWNAPQGPRADRNDRLQGLLLPLPRHGDRACGSATSSCRASTPTILLMGALFAGQYYDRDDAAEREIRKLVATHSTSAPTGISSAPTDAPAISMGWHPGGGLIPANWVGFNEGMFVNILALGSPTHPGPDEPVGAVDRALCRILARARGRRAASPSRLCSGTSTATSSSTSAASATR